MKTLCLDTSNQFLVLVLIEQNQIIDSYQEVCNKKQSELIIQRLDELFEKNRWKPSDLDSIVITKGPGSFTGVRIAMTVAKVMVQQLQIPLYTISTLQLYAGLKQCDVLLDARGQRAYYARYSNGDEIIEPTIITLDDYEKSDVLIMGDGSLIGLENNYPDFALNFFELKPYWQKVAFPELLGPDYLKKDEEYHAHTNSKG